MDDFEEAGANVARGAAPVSTPPMDYAAFLRAKVVQATELGRAPELGDVHPICKPHQADIIRWAVRGGRRGIFAKFGLGKSIMQLEAMRLTLAREGGTGLIVAPLGVRQEFRRDAVMLDIALPFIRTTEEMQAPGLYLTNYESVREGKVDTSGLTAVSLDEASVLRGFGGTKTFREFMRRFQSTPFRFVATATPAPKVRELVDGRPDDHVIIWHDLEDERRALERVLPARSYTLWDEYRDGHPDALALYERHYSARAYADERDRKLFVGPGEKLVLLTRQRDALFAWRKFTDDSGQEGINCAVFRNEGSLLSSELIREAMAIAWERWPGERFYTYVDAEEVRSGNPGYCFLAAGWKRLKTRTKDRGLVILEATPDVPFVPRVRPSMEFRSVYGSQDLDERETAVMDFADGKVARLAAKPVMLGSGCNLQRHCHWAIFAGVGFKFNDFIQAIHRIYRFLQEDQVAIDIIFAETEAEIVKKLKAKWQRHDAMMARMSELITQYGLHSLSGVERLQRTIGVERAEASGNGWRAIHNDCVEETRTLEADSVGLIVTSIPFGTQYEYTPSYNDFGHTDDDAHFFQQMDFLTPQLLRVLMPGRMCCVHVKDRVRPGGLDGLGFQTVSPFHADSILHYRRHGFVYMRMITVVTDVVRENAQTYRLGWGQQCKDGSRMGVGLPEYVLLFRKPPSDASDGYADVRVGKSKEEYSRARWQFDAHGYWKSNGNRLLEAGEIASLPADEVFKRFREWSRSQPYDHEATVAVGEVLDGAKRLPPGFMLLQPPSDHPDVWTDVARMRTLNGTQQAQGREQHLCPLQFDIVDRLIDRFSNAGDVVLDPFAGLFTVPLQALKKGRRGLGIELSAAYYADGVRYLRAAEEKLAAPTLFDVLDREQKDPPRPDAAYQGTTHG